MFRRDNLTGETLLVSRADGGGGAAQNGSAGVLGLAILGPAPFGAPAISADGNRIVFCSVADNLVAGDTNGQADVFVRDIAANTTVRASVQGDGWEIPGSSSDPAISGDGGRVAFVTAFAISGDDGNGDVDVYLRDLDAVDLEAGQPHQAIAGVGRQRRVGYSPALDADGDRVAFL